MKTSNHEFLRGLAERALTKANEGLPKDLHVKYPKREETSYRGPKKSDRDEKDPK